MSNNTLLNNADEQLCKLIDAQAAQNSQVWSLPGEDEDTNLHGLFLYPAMMVPGLQKLIVDIVLQAQPNVTSILDPFAGAGTSLAAAMHQGLDCYGQDINPLAVLLTRTRTGPAYNSNIRDFASNIVAIAEQDQSTHVEINFPNMTKWFQPEVSIALSKLKRAIMSEEDLWVRRFMWVTLAEATRFTSNDRTSTYKLHARPKEEIDTRDINVFRIFSEILSINLDKFDSFIDSLSTSSYIREGRYTGQINVAIKDIMGGVIQNNDQQKFDLLITSPPYGDNTTTVPYGQHSYLPLQWINFADIDTEANRNCLRTTHELDKLSMGGNLNLEGNIIQLLEENSPTLKEIFKQLRPLPKDRIARVAAFYRDFFIAIDNILCVMNNNAYLIWVVGNRTVGGITITTDEILCDYMQSKDVDFVTQIDRNIHKKRMPNRNNTSNTMIKERILFFRKKE